MAKRVKEREEGAPSEEKGQGEVREGEQVGQEGEATGPKDEEEDAGEAPESCRSERCEEGSEEARRTYARGARAEADEEG